jgi:hypothetical protein
MYRSRWLGYATALYLNRHASNARWYERAADEWWFGVSETEWINDELAFMWLGSFHAQTKHRVNQRAKKGSY